MNSLKFYTYIGVIVTLICLNVPVSGDEPDSVLIKDNFSQADSSLTYHAVVLNEEQLADIDHEDIGDWLIFMPGYYPLDQGGYAQPIRGQFMGLPSWAIALHYRNREYEDHLLGAPELGMISPGSLNILRFTPFGNESPGAALEGQIRASVPEPPSSRIGTRDGYYGLGFVDFDLTEKITPSFLLNSGGRVSTYNGRLPHSEGYGLNLRAEVTWWDSTIAQADSSGLWGWWGIMQNSRDSEVPYQSVSHNYDRYETDFSIHYRKFNIHGYGIQHRESWAGKDDGWDEVGIGVIKGLQYDDFNIKASLEGSLARWKLNNISWRSASFGGGEIGIIYSPVKNVRANLTGGFDYADDFDIKNRTSIRLTVSPTVRSSFFIGGTIHQRWPSRFETYADFPQRKHYLPYDPVFYQYPVEGIVGDINLNNETILSGFAGGGVRTDRFSGELNVATYKLTDPIRWKVENETIVSYNAPDEEFTGTMGWFTFLPSEILEIGGTGSYLPLDKGERRLFPELMLHSWIQYKLLLFNEKLDLRFRIWENLWGQRWFPVPGGWEKVADDFIVSGRISARIYGFHIYWGLNNIFSRDYELLPGLLAMHKEEVWGLSWNFVH